jgi:hypothetical protein
MRARMSRLSLATLVLLALLYQDVSASGSEAVSVAQEYSELEDLIDGDDGTAARGGVGLERSELDGVNKLGEVETTGNGAQELDDTRRPSPRILVIEEASGKYVRYGKGNNVLLFRSSKCPPCPSPPHSHSLSLYLSIYLSISLSYLGMRACVRVCGRVDGGGIALIIK